MNLELLRFNYSPTETEGFLHVGEVRISTIECPWVKSPKARGGTPFISCVPDGTYWLSPWTRGKSGAKVYILHNAALGVFREEKDRWNNEGRFLCLIHVANWVTDIEGCIAPGLSREILLNPKNNLHQAAVKSSGTAMEQLHDLLGRTDTHKLTIRPATGADDRRGEI